MWKEFVLHIVKQIIEWLYVRGVFESVGKC